MEFPSQFSFHHTPSYWAGGSLPPWPGEWDLSVGRGNPISRAHHQRGWWRTPTAFDKENFDLTFPPGRTPSPSGQPYRRRFHPHDCRRLEVFRPDLAGRVAHREEVLRVEGVPFHSHHLAAMALTKKNNLLLNKPNLWVCMEQGLWESTWKFARMSEFDPALACILQLTTRPSSRFFWWSYYRKHLASSDHELAWYGWLVGERVDVLGLSGVRLLLVQHHQEVSYRLWEVSRQGAKSHKNTTITEVTKFSFQF